MINLAQAGVTSKIEQYEQNFEDLKKRFTRQEIMQIDIRLLRCLEGIQSIKSVLTQIQSDSKCA